MSELLVRFVLGGLIVSVFAVLGDLLKPKTFAGIFGAAPAVALASLGLTFITKGSTYASIDGRSMVCGAVALAGYSVLVSRLLLRYEWNAVVAQQQAWLMWGALAAGLWIVFLR